MGTFKSYTLGFVLSILLTLAAYFLVVDHLLTDNLLVFTILTLAVIQLWVQLILFLHIGQEVGPKWKLAAWISTAGLILIVIIGSLWIMDNLSYHIPTDEEIIKDEGIH
jgi:cytochrome o ubiquinol oxidase operon protein cyoD